MRYRGLALVLAFVAHAATAQRPYDLPIRNAPVRTIAEFPGLSIGTVRPSGNPNRLYYNVGDTLYVLDVSAKKSAVVGAAEIWNLHVSPTNNRLVFVRNTEDGKVFHVWTMPLDPKTGLATAPARRLALTPGDQPRVSPDGKWVAFAAYDASDGSGTQHLAIIAADGGPERVVARLTGGIGRIQWTPDGRTIHFAGSQRGQLGQRGWKWLRVPVAGGQVDTLPIDFVAGAPGLSPDGRLIALTEGGALRNYVIADARGVPLSRFSFPPPFVGNFLNANWIAARSVVTSAVYRKNAVRVIDVDNGASREIVPPEFQPEMPTWSPDGKSIATFATSQGKRVLLVVDATTGKRREYAAGVVQACCVHDGSRGLGWSPDGRAIAFHGEYREPLRVIELATGAVRQVGPRATLIGDYRWRSDSRALQYTATANPRDVYRTIRETTLDGSDRLLVDQLPNGTGTAGMRSDTTAVVNSDSGVFLISVPTRTRTRLRSYFSPWVYSNRAGTGFALRDIGSDTRELEIVDAKGTRQAMVKFPALPQWGPYRGATLGFRPDGKLIVLGRATGGQYAIYVADLEGNEPKKLFDVPNKATQPHIDLSADGRFLVYTVEGPPTSVLAEIDLSSFVSGPQSRKP